MASYRSAVSLSHLCLHALEDHWLEVERRAFIDPQATGQLRTAESVFAAMVRELHHTAGLLDTLRDHSAFMRWAKSTSIATELADQQRRLTKVLHGLQLGVSEATLRKSNEILEVLQMSKAPYVDEKLDPKILAKLDNIQQQQQHSSRRAEQLSGAVSTQLLSEHVELLLQGQAQDMQRALTTDQHAGAHAKHETHRAEARAGASLARSKTARRAGGSCSAGGSAHPRSNNNNFGRGLIAAHPGG